jgi:hypothetical protein
MTKVDRLVCKKACPYADKGNEGICSLAMYYRKPKEQVCVSTVDIKVDKKEDLKQ